MARPAKRKSNGAGASASKATPTKSQVKEALSSPPSSRSLRQKSRPKYTEDAASDDSDDQDDQDEEEEEDASGYEDEDEDASEAAASSASEPEDEDASESDAPPRKKQKSNGNSARTVSKQQSSKSEVWRSDSKTGYGPGVEVVIKKPVARSPGKMPYKKDQIHPNTLLFLKDLAANNDREWLRHNDPDYRASWKDFMEFLEPLQDKIMEIDETVPELPLKDVIFRIYRDIRFSPDPTPYKAHFSAAWSRTGRKGPFAAYYVQIKAGGSFVGGGLWMPEASALAALRRDIDRKPHKIKNVLMNSGIRKHLLGGVAADEKKAVKAFAKQNADNALKRRPNGYDADHKDIELLKLKNFTMGHNFKDDDMVGPGGLERICEIVEALVPFVSYLNSVVMPDDEAEHDSEDNSNESDGDEEDKGPNAADD